MFSESWERTVMCTQDWYSVIGISVKISEIERCEKTLYQSLQHWAGLVFIGILSMTRITGTYVHFPLGSAPSPMFATTCDFCLASCMMAMPPKRSPLRRWSNWNFKQ